MPELYEMTQQPETAILIAADTGTFDVDLSLQELEELAETAGIHVLAQVTQKRDSLDRTTCIGAGKLEEIAALISSMDATLLIFDHELTATQLRNVEDACGIAVLDRTMLILDIFAQRARSSEGRLQVELAQHRYLLPRLSGLGKNLSRLGGGGGAGAGARRGKGETKLELDRRHIHRRIHALEEQLEQLTTRRDQLRIRRQKDGILTAAIVGYTNVGKSTLLNTLTDAGVLAEDQLFATLDPTARALLLPDGRSVMLIDTVGLIRRLPHHLVKAFRSTLEEAVHADLLLHVCDISNTDAAAQMDVTTELLQELGVADTPVLTILNKCDQIDSMPLTVGRGNVLISAKTGYGLDHLLEKIASMLPPSQRRMSLCIPYTEGALASELRQDGKVFSEQFTEQGIEIDALVDQKIMHKVACYQI